MPKRLLPEKIMFVLSCESAPLLLRFRSAKAFGYAEEEAIQ
jgi:hypothetical protein